MEKGIKVKHVTGMPQNFFHEFKAEGVELIFFEEGIKAQSFAEKLVEYMIQSSTLFPYIVLYDLMKDSAKKYLRSLPNKIINLWIKVKDTRPSISKGGKITEYKKPRVSFYFEVTESELLVIEIDDQIPDESLEKELKIFFELVELKLHAHIKEKELKDKLTLPIKSILKNNTNN